MRKLIITGYGRHGKDTVCEELNDQYDRTSISSSYFCNQKFIFEKLKDKYGYKTAEECYQDRHNHREEWFNLISEFTSISRTNLGDAIFEEFDIYCGIRNFDELNPLKEKYGDDILIIWVDASRRKDAEASNSMTVTALDCDIILDNNDELYKLVNCIEGNEGLTLEEYLSGEITKQYAIEQLELEEGLFYSVDKYTTRMKVINLIKEKNLSAGNIDDSFLDDWNSIKTPFRWFMGLIFCTMFGFKVEYNETMINKKKEKGEEGAEADLLIGQKQLLWWSPVTWLTLIFVIYFLIIYNVIAVFGKIYEDVKDLFINFKSALTEPSNEFLVIEHDGTKLHWVRKLYNAIMVRLN